MIPRADQIHTKTAVLFTPGYGRGSVILVFARLPLRSLLGNWLPLRVLLGNQPSHEGMRRRPERLSTGPFSQQLLLAATKP
jgi:hypothetical protein